MLQDFPLVCIFPYVALSEPFPIRGEMLFPYEYLEKVKIAEPEKELIREFVRYFYLYNNQLLNNLTWAILPASANNKRTHEFKTHMEQIRKILGFLCCVPDERPEWFNLYNHYEQVNYYLFSSRTRIWKKFLHCVSFESFPSVDEGASKYINGYEYSINQGGIWSIAPGCRIYPPCREVSRPYELDEHLEQLRYRQLRLNIFDLFQEDSLPRDQEERIFNALEWYNRSCSAEITTDVSLVYLAVAFETLLEKQREDEKGDRVSKTQRLGDSISFLIGDIPRLTDWFTQFYNARSRILHEGDWSQLRFTLQSDDTKSPPRTNEYGHLTHYGWLIFRICLNARVAGLAQAYRIDLKSKFFNHQERLKAIETILLETRDPYEAIDNIADDIKTLYRDPLADVQYVQFENVLNVGKLLAKKISELNIDVSPEQIVTLQKIVSDESPARFVGEEQIIQHALLVFQKANELPEEKVRSVAIQALSSEPPPSILDVKNNIIEILNDDRNKGISSPLRKRLQNIVELIEFSVYRSKLAVYVDLESNIGGEFISKHKPYSLIDGYSRFIRAIVEQNESDVKWYMSMYSINNTD